MRTSSQAHFITLCVREPDRVESDDLHAAAAAVDDWDAVIEMAASQRVAGFVQQAVTRERVILPAGVEEALHGVARTALMQVMRLDAELERVSERLTRAGISVIALKGPALARTIYGGAALRPYGDIDLTVRDTDEDAAIIALLDSDFREMQGEGDGCSAPHGHGSEGRTFARTFVSGHGAAVIELHVDPLQLGLKPVCEAARWQRATAIPGLPGVSMLCPEDQVVQLSAHVHRHGFNRLIWLKDLDLLLRAYQDTLDWDVIARLATMEGVSASVWYSLHLAHAILGAPTPPRTLARLRPSIPVRALYRVAWPVTSVANLSGQMRRRAVQFTTFESWRGMLPSLMFMGRRRDRARAAWRAVFPH